MPAALVILKLQFVSGDLFFLHNSRLLIVIYNVQNV